jgi:hypothetical protein
MNTGGHLNYRKIRLYKKGMKLQAHIMFVIKPKKKKKYTLVRVFIVHHRKNC